MLGFSAMPDVYPRDPPVLAGPPDLHECPGGLIFSDRRRSRRAMPNTRKSVLVEEQSRYLRPQTPTATAASSGASEPHGDESAGRTPSTRSS